MVYLDYVVPHAGTWIEILGRFAAHLHLPVVPHAGTWIEMCPCFAVSCNLFLSSLTQGRGLKYHENMTIRCVAPVVPHAGTWIEIGKTQELKFILQVVVPHAGTWIEINIYPKGTNGHARRPSRRDVDWNFLIGQCVNCLAGRPSRRDVDWNL